MDRKVSVELAFPYIGNHFTPVSFKYLHMTMSE